MHADLSGPLAVRLQQIRAELPAGTRLLAISKGQDAAAIRAAVCLGQRSFGESRLQEATAKQAQLSDLEPLDWHFIGRLQANKVRSVLQRFGTIHSIDSLPLAQRVARIAAEEHLTPGCSFRSSSALIRAKVASAPKNSVRSGPSCAIWHRPGLWG
jgi:uncharacterized pyridoxal phosphate-containing UPF0001 family protein